MKDDSGKVLLALLAGASAGIVAGLLMAPDAGTATRESLGKSLGKFGEDLNKLLQDGMSRIDALKGSVGQQGGGNADRGGAEDALADMAGKKAGSGSGPAASSAAPGSGISGGSGTSGGGTSAGSGSSSGGSGAGKSGGSSSAAGSGMSGSASTAGGSGGTSATGGGTSTNATKSGDTALGSSL